MSDARPRPRQRSALSSALLALLLAGSPASADPITYQGRLDDGGSPAEGSYDIRFTLYDDATPGAPDNVLGTVTASATAVSGGVFQASLDFGDVFDGAPRWLGIEIRPAGVGAYTALTTRQQIGDTPVSRFARVADQLSLPYNQSGPPDTANGSTFRMTNNGASGAALVTSGPTWGHLSFAGNTNPYPPVAVPAGLFGIGENTGTGGSSDAGSGVVGVTNSGYGGEFYTFGTNNGTPLWAHTDGTGTAALIEIDNSTSTANALLARTASTASSAAAVRGIVESTNAGSFSAGVRGQNMGTGTTGIGVYGSHAGSGWGVYGQSSSGYGVYGFSTSGTAGRFQQSSSTATADALSVTSGSTQFGANAIHGEITSTSPGINSAAVRGDNRGTGSSGIGVYGGQAGSGVGVWGNSGINGYGVVGSTAGANGFAGYFYGNVHVTGVLSKGSGTFKIDHPLDPANRYLSHSFVESPEMKNIYDGVATLDDAGRASVTMPDYFDALNTEFRYQLTCVGGYAPVYIDRELDGRTFTIAGGKPGLKVSWQVTGVRQDPFARANPVIVEQEKSDADKGRYLNPELYGQPKEMGIGYHAQPTQD